MGAVLQLVPSGPAAGPAADEEEALDPFVGVPLPVVFASPEQCEALREGETTEPVVLSPPFQMAAEDRYLVVPDDIGVEILDIVRDGDEELWAETLRDAVLLEGPCERWSDGRLALVAEASVPLGTWFAEETGYLARLGVGPGLPDPVQRLQRDPALRCTVVGGLLDEEGLDRALALPELLGVGWRPPARYRLEGVEPTLVWTRRRPGGRVGVELALFQEYEDLSVLLRPVVLELSAD